MLLYYSFIVGCICSQNITICNSIANGSYFNYFFQIILDGLTVLEKYT